MAKRISFILSVIVLTGCIKEEVGPQCPTCEEEVEAGYTDVFIGCEGNFGWGNASISLYSPEDSSITNSVFQNVNSFALGDVVQSVALVDHRLAVVVGNSNKIELLDTASYQTVGTITGLNSPRYISTVSSTKAYVTDLYANAISIVDLTTDQISGSIPVNGWTEPILTTNGLTYVGAMDTNMVYVIDPNTDVIIDTITTARGPNSMAVDENNQLWILCSGGTQIENGKLIQYDLISQTTIQELVFSDINSSPTRLRIASNGSDMYFLNQGVYAFNITDASLPSQSLIDQGSSTFYGLGIDPLSKNIYVADAIDYVQPGIVYRYDSAGGIIDQFNVGIIPQSFYFKE